MATTQPYDTEQLPLSAITTNMSATADDNGNVIGVHKSHILSSLPTELHAEIARHLDTFSLCDLSLVSRYWAKIAQGELHRCPEFDTGPDPTKFQQRSRVALLARTLACRPDLADKVHSLYSRSGDGLVETTTAFYGSYFRDDRMPYPGQHPEGHYVCEILRCVGNTRHFDLRTERENYPHDSIVWQLFGIDTSYGLNGQPDISNIPGLQNIKTLRLGGSDVHWEWLCLPKLKEAHIGMECSLLNPYRSIETYNLTYLAIDRGTDLVCLDKTPEIGFKQFLEGLGSLVKLTVTLCNVSMERDDTYSPGFSGHLHGLSPHVGSFDRLVACLAPIAPTLQHLEISECYHDDDVHDSCLEFIMPLTSLAHFEQLDTLDVPCEALVGINQRPLFEVLPASLRRLIVHEPSAAISTLLEGVPVAEKTWSLQVIELYTYSVKSFEEFWYRHPNIWHHLDEAKIFYHVRQWNGVWLEDWDDENYDPLVNVVVEFLADLHLDV